MSKPELNVVDHKNNIGQTITPGDEVVIVTTGYSHSVSIKKGVYLGKKNNGVSCRVLEQHTKYRFKETGEDVGYWWADHAKKRGVMPPRVDYPSDKSPSNNLRRGSPEYQEAWDTWQAAYAEYQKETSQYHVKTSEVGKDYEAFKVPYYRHTTLQLNRIYKLDTSVFDLEV